MSVTIDEPHQSREELIRERAYAIWLERMARGQPGTAEADWRLAELELALVPGTGTLTSALGTFACQQNKVT